MRADTIPARLIRQAELRPTAPAYYIKKGGVWDSTDWRTYVQEVRQTARALMALGLKPGDKVAMLGFNRPEWAIFALGAMCAGGAGAGVYTTSAAEEVHYVTRHAEAMAIVLEDQVQWEKIARQRENLPLLRHIVMMKGAPKIDAPGVLSWQEFQAKGDEIGDDELDERVQALEPETLATLIYTSGTTGPPKGVMLTHQNVLWTSDTLMSLLDSSADDRGLSYLPLSHIAEQMLTIYLPIALGSAVYYAESLDRVADNLREVQPTVVFGVPRIWEKMHTVVSARLVGTSGAKGVLVDWVRGVAAQVSASRNQGRAPGISTRVKYKVAEYLLLSKLRNALGLKNARMCMSGAAPIGKPVLEFFASVGIVIHEVYGQSEDCGPTTLNLPGKTRFGTVGLPMPGIEVKIDEDGEVLVKGPNVFRGYYKDEAETRASLKEGWLHTGDIGDFDSDGFLRITGRKKDIIITAGGKNITPSNIEASLKDHFLINEAVIIGDQRKYLTALITLDEDAVAQFTAERELDTSKPLNEIPELRGVVQEAIDEVNRHLARVETVKKFVILPRNFAIETGELTPTLKVKRSAISERYAELIEDMYRDA